MIESFFEKKYEDFISKKEGCRFPELCKYKYVGESLCSMQSLMNSNLDESMKEIDQELPPTTECSNGMFQNLNNEKQKGLLRKQKKILSSNKKDSDEKKKMPSNKLENFEFLKRKSPLNLKEDENEENKMLNEINNFTINKKVKVDNPSISSPINKNLQNTNDKTKKEIENKNDEVSIKKKGNLNFLNLEFVSQTETYPEDDAYKFKKFSSRINYEESIETEINDNMSCFVPMNFGSGSALLSLLSGKK